MKIRRILMSCLSLHAEGKINPEVSQKYALENSADAFSHLANRKAKGKVIINM